MCLFSYVMGVQSSVTLGKRKGETCSVMIRMRPKMNSAMVEKRDISLLLVDALQNKCPIPTCRNGATG